MASQKALLVPAVRGCVRVWSDYLSPYAFPLFWAERRAEVPMALRSGDVLLIALLVSSVLSFIFFPPLGHPLARTLLGGLAIYRLFDIAITLLNIGIFGSLRHDAALHELPRYHLHRILIATLMTYIELMFWFALLYLGVATAKSNQFDGAIHGRREAFFASMSTMTTTGYGRYAPVGVYALSLATVQAILGLTIYAIVIASVIGSLKDAEEGAKDMFGGYKRYMLHALTPLVAYFCCSGIASILVAG